MNVLKFNNYNLESRTPLYLTTYTGLCQPFPVGGQVIHDSFVRALQSQPSYQQDSQKDVGENGCEVYNLKKKYEQINFGNWHLKLECFLRKLILFGQRTSPFSTLPRHAMDIEYTNMDIHELWTLSIKNFNFRVKLVIQLNISIKKSKTNLSKRFDSFR